MLLVIGWLFTPYKGSRWTHKYGHNNHTFTAGIPVPWGRAGGCFQLACYCTRHLNNSIKINNLMQNLEVSMVNTFADYFPLLQEDLIV